MAWVVTEGVRALAKVQDDAGKEHLGCLRQPGGQVCRPGQYLGGEEDRVQVGQVVPRSGAVKVSRARKVSYHQRRSGARRGQTEQPGDRAGLADLGEVAGRFVEDSVQICRLVQRKSAD
jgi:hypothetical protein